MKVMKYLELNNAFAVCNYGDAYRKMNSLKFRFRKETLKINN